MTGPVSVGIVGAGTIACNVHIPVLRAMPQAQLAWIADTSSSKATTAAAANKTRGIHIASAVQDLPKADIVLLAIPLHVRAPYVEGALRAGNCVLAEKPFALDTAEHRSFLALGADWQLGCGYQRRFYGTTQLARTLIHALPFGRLRTIRIAEGARVTRAGAEGYIDMPVSAGGGLVKNLGCHSLDTAIFLTGASKAELLSSSVEWDGETDRHAHASIALSGSGADAADCRLDWTVSWLEPQRNCIELEFETARLRYSVSPGSQIDLLDAGGKAACVLNAPVGAATINQAFYLEWVAMIEGMQRREPSAVSARSSLLVAELMDQILEKRVGT